MRTPPPYDGTGKIGDALAALHGISPRSHNKIAELISEAKTALNISTKAKRLPDDVKLAIYRWHYGRLNPVSETVESISQDADSALVEINSQGSQTGNVETFSQSNDSPPVEINSQDDKADNVEIVSQSKEAQAVETISQPSGGQSVKTISQHDECKPVEIVSQDTGNESVEINSQYGFNDLVRIAFYTPTAAGRKRQVIALDGFYLNALMLATGIDKKGIPAWVQQAVDGWPAFDAELPITKQVKYLLIQELTARKDIGGDHGEA